MQNTGRFRVKNRIYLQVCGVGNQREDPGKRGTLREEGDG